MKDKEVVMAYLSRIKLILGENYRETSDDVLQEIVKEMTSVACDIANRDWDDERLFPYISKAVRAEYLARGAEGLLSNSEGSISNSFEDIVDKMRCNIVRNGVRRLK